ncbi:MAG: SH3 domain-containing protein [Gammaproteobacteria bacterium]
MNVVDPMPQRVPLGSAGWLLYGVFLAVFGVHADPPGTSPGPSVASTAVAPAPIDQGMAMRNAALRDMPDRAGKVVGQLPANTPVLLFERARLWVRVRPLNAPADTPLAWASLLDFRFGAAPTAAAPAAAVPGRPPVTTGAGGVFAGFSRSVSGLLAGFQGRSRHGGDTATIGIRGLTSAELGGAAPDYQGLARMEGFAITPQDAQAYAFAGGLVPQRLVYLAAPAPVPAAAPAPERRPFR